MTVFEIQKDTIRPIDETTFAAVGIKERSDLQRLLRDQIDIVASDIFVIAEEFGDWDESNRRIDLLAIAKNGNLVVIELKRTEDGGHSELQAVRYAAMVSAMTFSDAVKAHEKYLAKREIQEDAQKRILKFLDWDEVDEDNFAQDIEIILASAEFSKELTTAVLWLNERELNITCVRLKPYLDGEKVLLDVQQVIPIKEAEEYQIKIRQKQAKERVARKKQKDYTKFDVTIDGVTSEKLSKRKAIFQVVKALCDRGVDPNRISEASGVGARMFLSVDGEIGSVDFVGAAVANGNFDPSRFNCADGELIPFSGKTYALTNQWGSGTQVAIEKSLSAFPDLKIGCRTHEERDWDEASFLSEARAKTGQHGHEEIQACLEWAKSLGATPFGSRNSVRANYVARIPTERGNFFLFQMEDNGDIRIRLVDIMVSKSLKLDQIRDLVKQIPGLEFLSGTDETHARITHANYLERETKKVFQEVIEKIADEYKKPLDHNN
ncbi:MAG: hypothetical protein AAF939_17360 [Planctomycetota bacterium]